MLRISLGASISRIQRLEALLHIDRFNQLDQALKIEFTEEAQAEQIRRFLVVDRLGQKVAQALYAFVDSDLRKMPLGPARHPDRAATWLWKPCASTRKGEKGDSHFSVHPGLSASTRFLRIGGTMYGVETKGQEKEDEEIRAQAQ